MTNNQILWTPSEQIKKQANMTAFIDWVNQTGLSINNYASLYQWSIDHPDHFWSSFWEFSGIISSHGWDRVVDNLEAMPGASWFPGAQLNFAENLLRYKDDRTAIIACAENRPEQKLSYAELNREVGRYANFLKTSGIKPGDRVAGYITNGVEAVIAMLATTSIGAVWSSCSPDFGAKGVLARFLQIEPRILFAVDGYRYNGKKHSILDRVKTVVQSIPSIEKTVIIPFLDPFPDISEIQNSIIWQDANTSSHELEFTQMPFESPLFIMYSSGTTGKPKCIVHGIGGSLIQLLKEHRLHTDLKRDDVLFFFTTCGWMMWNWLVGALASGSTLILYDGSPFFPAENAMWDMSERLDISIFGTSARFISACAKQGLTPGKDYDLSAMRILLSTGSPLTSKGFDYVYQNIKEDVQLSSMSGGTDIMGCFVIGNPLYPVYRGEIQCRALGMAVDVFEDSVPVRGRQGELVCTKPFPSMPLGFWNEPDDSKYRSAYFERFDGVWAHGDYAEITEHDGMIIYGRSDAVLNPGGVRIGTAEIYSQIEKIDEVIESLCIGQRFDGDVRIILFINLRKNVALTDDLKTKIRDTIRKNTSTRHVPEKIIAVPDIPRTLSGKITELVVRDLVHGYPIKTTEALANPESLQYFQDLPDLQN
ncbi:MAG: acetoacetate--CoA ligase [Gammaproteobacteria bacterium]|nr:acetoacetate--CoA ligase [Gammaproteobacteria bacterium]